ncbi:putative cysteine ligase BshC [Jeotgalicoccus coquinae]|uniref:Putative cysteine ligase BshC n=1 Tax=Jeotgalicoccus coquinae TaxID=709509 RepID=A0A6V7RJC6_9STAP|nr:bacillithiol biosynthesis cysteine-adding enzyme BshC [Jeotgalicoccus coquinae]MBB6422528.1 bacillithiol biosynthesis cysteine-adding enzyme BshC [Jeotgalicoccus coquinae]GGE15172.1 putative cysteine ligase BshC [Jeotgalicoccus coquinae]CAD2078233.1 Putative cysteine ligase BshC [Jeotgalicoccus coquinae]
MHFETIDFSGNIHNTTDNKQFYGGLSYDDAGVKEVLQRPVHNHTAELGSIIEADMAQYGLTDAQKRNIELLKKGHKVVIAGQQAGLFMSPSYIIHKIVSILVVAKEFKDNYDYDAVPVFWVAGEDHDFEEVNHTHLYDTYHRRRVKVNYKPNLTVPMSIGFYNYDKKAMAGTLEKVVKYIGDSDYTADLKKRVTESIERCTSWTELFHSLVHDTFKDDGLVIFNSHLESVRKLEVPIMQNMFKNHKAIDAAFKTGQKAFLSTVNKKPVIQTDTNVHLFGNATSTRELITETDDGYMLNGESLSADDILKRIEQTPAEFSNNVVTRPLMQEMLFNTAVFLGGGAEVSYWGELHKVFDVVETPMPIVMKRMEFMHVDSRIEKLLDKYGLTLDSTVVEQIQERKETLIQTHMNDNIITEIERVKETLENAFKPLYDYSDDYFKSGIIDGNKKRHMNELDYLKKRYSVDVKRSLRTELNNLDELSEKLMPNGALQERLFHPWQYQVGNWDYSPLSYTEKLTLIKS